MSGEAGPSRTVGDTWVEPVGEGRLRIGVVAEAASGFGDVTWVGLPDIGRQIGEGDPLVEVESAKATTDVPSPEAGIIVEVNTALDDDPGLVGRDPTGEGWLVIVEQGSGH